ncbi:MAG: hypothetical protein ACYTE3_15065 [Planctomycetota bacterium]|jgi:hypothetical protein
MNRTQIFNLVVEKLRAIQEIAEGEAVEISKDTVPIDQLPGFDSLIDVEFAYKIDEHIPLDKSVRLCVAKDGKPLNVGQIVDRLVNICGGQKQGEDNGEE